MADRNRIMDLLSNDKEGIRARRSRSYGGNTRRSCEVVECLATHHGRDSWTAIMAKLDAWRRSKRSGRSGLQHVLS